MTIMRNFASFTKYNITAKLCAHHYNINASRVRNAHIITQRALNSTLPINQAQISANSPYLQNPLLSRRGYIAYNTHIPIYIYNIHPTLRCALPRRKIRAAGREIKAQAPTEGKEKRI